MTLHDNILYLILILMLKVIPSLKRLLRYKRAYCSDMQVRTHEEVLLDAGT